MRKLLVIAVLALAAAATFADAPAAPPLGQPGSLVEVYGLIDTGLRISTNYDAAGEPYFGFSQGLFNGTRWGVRGTETLDGNLKAIYALESGIVLPYGMPDQQGQLFGRQAWVGVSSDYGALTFGRQYGTFSDALGVGDVFGAGHGNIGYNNGKAGNANSLSGTDAVNSFYFSETGFRWDQSIKYAGNFNGVTAGAMAMLGNLTTSYQENTMFAGSLGYGTKDLPVSGAVGVQYEIDANLNHHLDVGGGLKYALDATDAVYVFYFHSAFDQGFTRINANNSEFAGPFALARTDDIAQLSANYYVDPSANLIVAGNFDYAQNVLSSGDNGYRVSVLGALDYYFSKNFDAYVSAWYTSFSGVLQNTANGGDLAASNANPVSSSLSFMVGARYRF